MTEALDEAQQAADQSLEEVRSSAKELSTIALIAQAISNTNPPPSPPPSVFQNKVLTATAATVVSLVTAYFLYLLKTNNDTVNDLSLKVAKSSTDIAHQIQNITRDVTANTSELSGVENRLRIGHNDLATRLEQRMEENDANLLKMTNVQIGAVQSSQRQNSTNLQRTIFARIDPAFKAQDKEFILIKSAFADVFQRMDSLDAKLTGLIDALKDKKVISLPPASQSIDLVASAQPTAQPPSVAASATP